MMQSHKTAAIAALSLALSATTALAHHAWVIRHNDGYQVVYGHEKYQGYVPAKVKEVKAFDTKGKSIALKQTLSDSAVTLAPAAAPAWILVHFDNGFWTKTTEGSKNISKQGIADYLSSSHSVKYSKNVFMWSDKLTKPMGQPLEVVPAAKPANDAGDTVTLEVTIYRDGKPAPSVPVSAGGYHHASDTTDALGKAKVRVSARGPNLIVASHKVPLKNNPDADTLSVSGALFLHLSP